MKTQNKYKNQNKNIQKSKHKNIHRKKSSIKSNKTIRIITIEQKQIMSVKMI